MRLLFILLPISLVSVGHADEQHLAQENKKRFQRAKDIPRWTTVAHDPEARQFNLIPEGMGLKHEKKFGPKTVNIPILDETLLQCMDDFDNDVRDNIVELVKENAESPWHQLALASRLVFAYFKENRQIHEEGIRSPCRDHAIAYREVVEALNLPNVSVYYQFYVHHVVNIVTLRGEDGKLYQYVVDVGTSPNYFLARNQNAISQQKNSSLAPKLDTKRHTYPLRKIPTSFNELVIQTLTAPEVLSPLSEPFAP